MDCLVFCAAMCCLGLYMVVGVYWFDGGCDFVLVNSVDYFGSLFLYISFDFNFDVRVVVACLVMVVCLWY